MISNYNIYLNKNFKRNNIEKFNDLYHINLKGDLKDDMIYI